MFMQMADNIERVSVVSRAGIRAIWSNWKQGVTPGRLRSSQSDLWKCPP
jgi:hypothetical protein